MSSSNLLKRGYGYVFQDDDARIIDSNGLVADRLDKLAETMVKTAESDEGFHEGFTEGLNAIQVEKLLSDEEQPEGEQTEENSFSDEDYQEMLIKARNEAEDIIQEAKEQALSQKNGIFEEAKSQGYQEGIFQAEKDLEQQRIQLQNKAREQEQIFDNNMEQMEGQLVETLTDIYDHIFHVQFSSQKEVIFYLIQNSLSKIEGGRNFIVHVSKEDYGFVSMQKKELFTGLSGAENSEIVEDLSLKQNECLIETNSGLFDCGLETQLAGLKRELRLLSHTSSKSEGEE